MKNSENSYQNSELYYKTFSLIPKTMLFTVFTIIYFFFSYTYMIPLMLNEYNLNDFSETYYNFDHRIQQIIYISKYFNFVQQIQDNQTKGIVIFAFFHVIFVLMCWSIYQTINTPPGCIKNCTLWNAEIDQFVQGLKQQQFQIQQQIKEKYKQTNSSLQRSKQNTLFLTFKYPNNKVNSKNLNSNDIENNKQKLSVSKDLQLNIEQSQEQNPKSSSPIKIICSQNIDGQSSLSLNSKKSESEVCYEEGLNQEKSPLQNPLNEIYDQEEFERLLQQLYYMHIQNEISQKQYRQCKKCLNIMKPPRTHHCSQCKVCVLKMDHHCQWVDNCIGFNNYKYFSCMLLYSSILLVFTFFNYINCYLDALISENIGYFELYCIVVTFYLIIVLMVIINFLTGFHIMLICQNKTTIEYSEKKKDSHALRRISFQFSATIICAGFYQLTQIQKDRVHIFLRMKTSLTFDS